MYAPIEQTYYGAISFEENGVVKGVDENVAGRALAPCQQCQGLLLLS